jgi:hypothetical protein
MNKETGSMNTTSHSAVGRIGPYRAIRLSKILDPATEKRRCALRRHEAPVLGVTDYQNYHNFLPKFFPENFLFRY